MIWCCCEKGNSASGSVLPKGPSTTIQAMYYLNRILPPIVRVTFRELDNCNIGDFSKAGKMPQVVHRSLLRSHE